MKKFISMALALMMTLSLCTFVAAPKAEADFDDADEFSSKYAEQAIDVIQTIEVMDGYDDNTFKPTAGLTRQAAAKIICNMILGPTTAKALPTNASPFPDVLPDTQWAGYISYCLQQGIISGYSDGTFKGGDPLSGYAYLKMLLGALGYDAEEEGFVGSNWKVNVAKTALGIGLDRGISVELDGTTQVTREDAAIYAFNTLQADMVEYESKNTIEVNGVKLTMGGSNAVPQTWGTSATQANNISAITDTNAAVGAGGRPIVQFAERYFDKLEREPNGTFANNGRDSYIPDVLGRPCVRWIWKGVEVGVYPRDPDAVFTGNVKVNKIYEELGMTSSTDNGVLYINSDEPNNIHLNVARTNDKDLNHFTNLLMFRQEDVDNARTVDQVRTRARLTPLGGVAGATLVTAADVHYSMGVYDNGVDGGDDVTHYVDRIGDGCRVECFLNSATNDVDVCVISQYGGKVDAVKGATAKKDAYVTIDWGDHNGDHHFPDGIGNADHNEFETDMFEEDDVVAYTYSDSDNSIRSMTLLSAESGVLQSRINGKSIRLDNDTYKYGCEYTFKEITEASLSIKSSYVVYFDENDFVLWVEEDEFSVENFALIESITLESGDQVVTSSLAQNNAVVPPFAAGLETTFRQVRAAANTSSEAKAQIRYPSGTRRTVSLDDSKNYRTDVAGDVAGINQLTNASGDGNGHWIANVFTAGHIVRVSSNSDGYRLHSINSNRLSTVNGFVLTGNQIWQYVAPVPPAVNGTITAVQNDFGTFTIQADSETHFAVEDTTQGSYKSYVGVKNAPDVARNEDGTYSPGTTAYIYHIDRTAKLVFVTQAAQVSSSSNDIVFLAANSLSDRIESDDGFYYEITAVEKNQVKTLTIRAGRNIMFSSNDAVFSPDAGGQDKAYNCVILNNVTYDSNDFVTRGSFTGGPGRDNAYMAQGIRRVNAEEVRINTAAGRASQLRDIAENVRVYFVDGSEIEQIDYADIVNDTQDYVYYVQNNNGEITYLFIVDYEADTDIATANITEAAREISVGKGNNTGDANTYAVEPTATTTIEAGGTFSFVLRRPDLAAPADVITGGVKIQVGYQSTVNPVGVLTWANAVYNAADKVWDSPAIGTALFPLATGTEIEFQIIP